MKTTLLKIVSLLCVSVMFSVSACTSTPPPIESTSPVVSLDGGGDGSYRYLIDDFMSLNSLVPIIYTPDDSIMWVGYTSKVLKNGAELRQSWGDSDIDLNNEKDFPLSVLNNAFDKITLTSDTDFNDIPSGSNLGGEVLILTVSALPTINNKILEIYPYWEQIPDYNNPRNIYGNYLLWPVAKPLDELTKEDLSLLIAARNEFANVCFKFLTIPEQPVHTFTITYYEGDDKWSCSFKIDFSNPHPTWYIW